MVKIYPLLLGSYFSFPFSEGGEGGGRGVYFAGNGLRPRVSGLGWVGVSSFPQQVAVFIGPG